MKKTFLLLVYCILFTVYHSYAQVPADSLPGTYAGQYWLANPYTSPWVITPDTLFASNIDSANCTVATNDVHNFVLGGGTYFTDYYSCNSIPPYPNGSEKIKFYSGDSVYVICDSMSLPPPPLNNHWTYCFYGKRISNLTGINELSCNKQIDIYPNPSINNITIETPQDAVIEITNIQGQLIKTITAIGNKTNIDVSALPGGVYVVEVKTKKGVAVRKFVKE